MVKKEEQDYPKTNVAPDPTPKSNPNTLKDDPDGETICSADFTKGCVNSEDEHIVPLAEVF